MDLDRGRWIFLSGIERRFAEILFPRNYTHGALSLCIYILCTLGTTDFSKERSKDGAMQGFAKRRAVHTHRWSERKHIVDDTYTMYISRVPKEQRSRNRWCLRSDRTFFSLCASILTNIRWIGVSIIDSMFFTQRDCTIYASRQDCHALLEARYWSLTLIALLKISIAWTFVSFTLNTILINCFQYRK